jgi:hypothetical protein
MGMPGASTETGVLSDEELRLPRALKVVRGRPEYCGIVLAISDHHVAVRAENASRALTAGPRTGAAAVIVIYVPTPMSASGVVGATDRTSAALQPKQLIEFRRAEPVLLEVLCAVVLGGEPGTAVLVEAGPAMWRCVARVFAERLNDVAPGAALG